MPDNYKLNQAWTKFLLRKSMEDILPPKIAWRVDKIAYETPQNNWLSNIKSSVQTKVILEYFNDFGISIKKNDIDNISDWNYYLTSKYI
jgi:asparagine synthase (glutamine-hydrolysing)